MDGMNKELYARERKSLTENGRRVNSFDELIEMFPEMTDISDENYKDINRTLCTRDKSIMIGVVHVNTGFYAYNTKEIIVNDFKNEEDPRYPIRMIETISGGIYHTWLQSMLRDIGYEYEDKTPLSLLYEDDFERGVYIITSPELIESINSVLNDSTKMFERPNLIGKTR